MKIINKIKRLFRSEEFIFDKHIPVAPGSIKGYIKTKDQEALEWSKEKCSGIIPLTGTLLISPYSHYLRDPQMSKIHQITLNLNNISYDPELDEWYKVSFLLDNYIGSLYVMKDGYLKIEPGISINSINYGLFYLPKKYIDKIKDNKTFRFKLAFDVKLNIDGIDDDKDILFDVTLIPIIVY